MKQDDPGESDLPMELAKASTPGAWRAIGDENSSGSPSQEEAQASSRGWAKGDYRSFAARSVNLASR